MNRTFVSILILGFLVGCLPPLAAQTEKVTLDAKIVAQVDQLLRENEDPRPLHNALWLATRSIHGHVDVLVDHLEELIEDDAKSKLHLAATRLLAQIQRRDGYLLEALSTIDSIGDDKKSIADLVFNAEVLDAQGRTDKAVKQYDEILTKEIDDDLRKLLLLRRALMQKESAAALAAFVKEDGRSREQKNEASVILALLDDQKTAIATFAVEGEKTVRFRQEVRLAEWAIECKDFDRAQEWAWAAWQSAKMRRDQRYALTLIASAYRRDKAVPELLERFAKMEDMSADARQLWIRLLREEGRVDDALKLFREGRDTKFTAPMRRQLLEICRETGREDILVGAFQELIRTDPGNLEWRSGLSRYRLENGDKEKAVAIWDDFAAETKPKKLIDASFTLVDVGLDDVAERLARLAAQQKGYEQSGLLFVFKMHLNGGNNEKAIACLEELSAVAAPDSGLRADIADGYERVGRPDLAVSTLRELRKNRDGFLGTDLEMKLAILLSKTAQEEEALKIWRSLWVRLRTSPRARFVEDRMMTVASRLGVLAKIAIELEDRLQTGDAQDQDVDLLVRLYIKVGDPASATEILEEYLKSSGSADLEVTKRKAKIFRACSDYYNYEKLMEILVKEDEEGRLDHLRELAMSQLERGRRDLAIGLLPMIREASGENVEIADEFEAGIYSIVGMKSEALSAYLRGMGRHPERIDTYLLISNLLRETGGEMRAVKMFQYMAQTAVRDDLFTIAIDGILNLRAPRQSGVPDEPVQWALRTTLERLATKPHRFYLYRLAADLAEELKDMPLAIRALKAGLPVAGERRTPIMREIMNKCHALDPKARQIFGNSEFNPSDKWDATEYVMVGRRLLGQGDHVPPSIFMNLATIFIRQGDIKAAMRTFSRASELLEYAEVTREAARVLESAGEIESSLKFYRRLLATSPNDPTLIAKVGNIEEELGKESSALDFYRRALSMIISHKPRFVTRLNKGEAEDPMAYYRGGNVDEETALYQKLMRSLQVTLKDRGAASQMLSDLEGEIKFELDSLAAGDGERILADHPRLDLLVQTSREISLSFGLLTTAARHDRLVLSAFASDRAAILKAVKARRTRGYLQAAQTVVEKSAFANDASLLSAAGSSKSMNTGEISIAAASARLVDLLGRPDEEMKIFLDRVDSGKLTQADVAAIPSVLSACIISKNQEVGERLLRAGLRKSKSKNVDDTSLSQLIGLAKRLDVKLARAIFIEQAETRLIDEPRSYYEIMQIEEALGGDIFDSETAARILTNSAKNADKDLGFGAVELLGSVEKSERPTILRDLYDSYPASKKAALLAQAVYYMEGPLDESFEDWYANSLANDLKTGDTMRVRLSNNPLRGQKSTPSDRLLLKVARVVDANKPNIGNIGIQVGALVRLERETEALTLFESNLTKFVGSDYEARRARDSVVGAFVGRDQGKLLTIIEKSLAKDPAQKELSKMRWDLMKKVPDYGERLQVEVKKSPQDVAVLEALVNYHSSLGHQVEMTEVLQKLVAIQPDNKRWSRRLERTWKSMFSPLAMQKPKFDPKKKDEKDKSKVQAPAVTGMATLMSALTVSGSGAVVISGNLVTPNGQAAGPEKEIQDLITKGDLKQAQAKLRAHWRGFHMQGLSPYRAGFPMNLILRYRSIVFRPTPGVVTIFGAIKNPPPFVADEARLLLRILAGVDDYSVPEIRAELLKVIASAIPKDSRKEEQDRLETLAKTNKANIDDLELLLHMVANDTGEVPALVVDLTKRPEIPNAGRLRLLAGVLARAGKLDQAGRLYRLGVLGGGGDEEIFSGGRGNGLTKMVDRVEKELGKKAADYALALVDDRVMSATGYNAGSLALQAIAIWQKKLSPHDTMSRVESILPMLNSRYVGRNMQRNAVPAIFARCGSYDLALQEAKGVLCRNDEDAQRLGGYVRSIPKNTVEIMVDPKGEWKDHAAWSKMLAEEVIKWHREEILLSPATVFTVFAAALHADGHTDLSEQFLTLAKDNSKGGRALGQLADTARKMGKIAEADRIEEELLTHRRLAINKIKDVVQRIMERDEKAGFAAAEEATKYTLTPKLLEYMIERYDAVENNERAQHWRGILEQVKPKKVETPPKPKEDAPKK